MSTQYKSECNQCVTARSTRRSAFVLPWYARSFCLFLLIAIGVMFNPARAQQCTAPSQFGNFSPSGIVNTYYPGTAAGSLPAGSTSVPVGAINSAGASTPIAAGDLILIIQLQDAAINSSNNGTYGDGVGSTVNVLDAGQGSTSLRSAGLYEYAIARGPVTGGVIPIAGAGAGNGLINTYFNAAATATDGQRRYQVVRVPQFTNITLTGTVTAPPWDGSSGGIVALDVAGTFAFSGGRINVDGLGFRGGAGQQSQSNATGQVINQFDYRIIAGAGALNLAGVGSIPFGIKGEGIAGTPVAVYDGTAVSAVGTLANDGTSNGYPAGSFGRGAPGNAGGGGNDSAVADNSENAGGGGGANGGSGGRGGNAWNTTREIGGFGGAAFNTTAGRVAFGGGGGSGARNNSVAPQSSGGRGGGMVFIRAGAVSGTGTVSANGAFGVTPANDGGGGGGAGGSIVFLSAAGNYGGVRLLASGANGTDANYPVAGANQAHGPGGGGGGGVIWISGSAFSTVDGGVQGRTSQYYNNDPASIAFGALPGDNGVVNSSLTAGVIPGPGQSQSCRPVLTVTKTTSTPIRVSGVDTLATYTITVANSAAGGTAYGTTISDVLPAGFTYTTSQQPVFTLSGGASRTATLNPAGGATTPVFGTFTIPASGSVAITFSVSIAGAAPATYQNPATVSFLDPTAVTPGATISPGGTYAAGGTVGGSNYVAASSTGEDVTIVNRPTVTKAFGVANLATSAQTTLTLTISSNNPSFALSALSLVDDLPNGMQIGTPAGAVSATTNANNTCGLTFLGGTTGSNSINVTNGTVAAGAPGTCTLIFNVSSSRGGPAINTVLEGNLQGTATVNGAPVLLTNVAAASASINIIAPPQIRKTFSPNAIALGATSTLTIEISNTSGNTVPLTGVSFADNYPAGITNTAPGSIAPVGAGCVGNATSVNGGTPGISLAGATIPANATCTYTTVVTKAIASPAGGDVNTISGAGTVAATGPVAVIGNVATDTLVVSGNLLPPTITKSFGAGAILAAAGNTTTMSITIANPNASVLSIQSFADDFPAGMTLLNGTIAFAPNAAPCNAMTVQNQANGVLAAGNTGIRVNGGTLAANSTCTITLNITAPGAGAYVNTTGAFITTTAPLSNAATASLTVVAAPSAAKSFSPATIPLGGTSRVRILLTNAAANTVPITGVAFTDPLPAGLAVAATPNFINTCGGTVTSGNTTGQTSIAINTAAIPVGGSCEVAVDVIALTPGPLTNPAFTVTAANAASVNTAAAILTVQAIALPPQLTKTFSPSPTLISTAGGTAVLTFVVSNPNPGAALTNIQFLDTLPTTPGAMTIANATTTNTCGGSWQGRTGVAAFGAIAAGNTALQLLGVTLAAGATCSVSAVVQAPAIGSYSNVSGAVSATIGATTLTGNAATDALLVTNILPPITSKTFRDTYVRPGGTTQFTLTFTNPNSNAAITFANPAFTDALPANLTFGTTPVAVNTCALTQNAVSGGNTFSVTGGSIPAGGACTLTMNIQIAAAAASGNRTNSIASVVTTNAGTGAGASGSTVVTPLQAPSITKSFSPAQIPAGGTATLTITITNPNTTDALTGVAFGDNYPAGLTNSAPGTVAPAGTGCAGNATSVNGGTPGLSLAGATIPAGGTCSYSLSVTKATVGNVVNTLTTAVSATGPAALTGNIASAVLGVAPLSPPIIVKSFSPVQIAAAGQSTLTITITNPNAGTPLTGVAFTDTYPAGTNALTTVTPGSAAFDAGSTSIGCTGTLSSLAGSLSLAGGTIPADATCRINVLIADTGSTTGARLNTIASITSTNGGTGNAASATLTVGAAAVLPPTVTKYFSPNPIVQAGNTRLYIEIRNPNTATNLTGISITDNLATSGLRTRSPANAGSLQTSGGACTGIGGLPGDNVTTFTLTGITLNAGTSACLFFVDVEQNPPAPGTAGNFVNTTGTVAATGPSALTGNAASATLTVLPTGSTLQRPVVTKSFSPTTIVAGGTSRLRVTISNPNATASLTGVGFTDTFPVTPGAMRVAATPNRLETCTGFTLVGGAATNTNYGGTGGTIIPGSTCVFEIDVTAPTVGTYRNTTGTVTSSAGNGNVGTADLRVVSLAPVSITKNFQPTVIAAGGVSQLIINLFNPNAGTPVTMAAGAAASGGAFEDGLPTGMSIANATVVNTCGGTVQSRATIGAGNYGAFTAAHLQWRLSGGTILAGGSCQIIVNVTSATPGTVLNTTTAVTTATPAVLTGNAASAALSVAPLALQLGKTFSPSTIGIGGTSAMTFTVTNPNGFDVTGANFTDNLVASDAGWAIAATPGAVSNTFNAVTNNCGTNGLTFTGGTAAATTVNVTGGTIPAASTCVLTLNVTATTAGSKRNTTSAIGGTGVPNGNAGSAVLNVVSGIQPPQLSKSFTPSTFAAGGQSQLRFTITNPNQGTALSGLAFTDNAGTGWPASLTIAAPAGAVSGVVNSANSCGLTFTGGATGNNNVVVTAGTVAAGATCTLTFNVTSNTAGAATNTTGTISASSPAALVGNAASAGYNVLQASNLVIAKSFSPSVINLGQSSQLRIVITNPNTSIPVTNLAFTDDFSGGSIQVASVLSLANTCGGVIEGATGAGAFGTVAAGNNRLRLTNGVLTAGASCVVEVNVTSLVVGVGIPNPSTGLLNATASAGTVPITSNAVSATLSVGTNAPSFTKNVVTICDPFNGSSFPKAIPGAYVRYSITVTNTAGLGSVTLTSISDTLSALLNFDASFLKSTGIAASPTGGACSLTPPASLEPGGAANRGFRMSCSNPTVNKRACATAANGTFFTTAPDADAIGLTGSTVNINFATALPAETVGTTNWGVGELKANESVTIQFNAIVK